MSDLTHIHELSKIDRDFSMEKVMKVLALRDLPLSSPYPYRDISEVQLVCNQDTPGPENGVARVFIELCSWCEKSTMALHELTAVMFFERLEHDEHALNWVTHAVLSDFSLAGNDLNLVDLILCMTTQQKLAVLCAASNGVSNLPMLALRYDRYLDEAVQFICQNAAQPRCSVIDSLPVNFELTYFNTMMLNSENGKPGSSTVILNASPLNTLPRSLLYEIGFYEKHLPVISDKTIERAKRFSLPTELSLRLAYEYLAEMHAYTTSDDLRSAIHRKTSGTVEFDDVFVTEWNTQYPVTTAELSDVQKVAERFPRSHALSPSDAQQMCATFSKFIAYGEMGGLSHDLISQYMIDHASFFRECFINPGPSPLHNFVHRAKPFGREQVDAYIDQYHDVITGGYISRYCSVATHTPEMGERLLNYLEKMHVPAKGAESSDILYHHAIARMIVESLKRGQELGVFDPKEIALSDFMNQSLMGRSVVTRDDDVYDRPLFERALCALPAELLSLDIRMCCGLSLSPSERERATEAQLEKSFTLDLNL